MRPVFAAGLVLVYAALADRIWAEDSNAPSLVSFDIEGSALVDNPWAGVDSTTGNLLLPLGRQLAVNDNGNVNLTSFGPSVAVGDLNGDGLPDLVVADARGFIWFFPNSGSKSQAVFTHGEVMPIWFGSPDAKKVNPLSSDVVPHIQLVDSNGNGKLDIVAGTYGGNLYLLPNSGSQVQPQFLQPSGLDAIRIATRHEGVLWCNFLAPTFYSWDGRGVRDLIMGEGSYSANSIYLLHNQGDNVHPIFNEDRTLRMLPGNGLEHLTPRVIDWNGDGKPDVIAGERTGHIELYLNTSTDPLNPTFASSTVTLGNQSRFGQMTTVEIGDLNGNHLPNLLVSNSQGGIVYATNTGTLGHPQFTTDPVPLKGTNPFPKIYEPRDWTLTSPFGNAYGLLVATSADVEKGFEPPADVPGKSALRAYVFEPGNVWFKDRYTVDPSAEVEEDEHDITYKPLVPLQAGANYEISFYVKVDGDIEATRYRFLGHERMANGQAPAIAVEKSFSASDSWDKVTSSFSWTSKTPQKNAVLNTKLSFRWHGSGSIYLDAVEVRERQ
jgi:hypothetical protein